MTSLQTLQVDFTFRTEHVVGLIGMVTKSQPVLVLMEFMENGDLRNFLVKHRQGCKFQGTTRCFFLQARKREQFGSSIREQVPPDGGGDS